VSLAVRGQLAATKCSLKSRVQTHLALRSADRPGWTSHPGLANTWRKQLPL